MSDVEALGHLAQLYGIEPVWHDIWGGRHEVTHETLRALLGAMHVPAATDEQVRNSLRCPPREDLGRERAARAGGACIGAAAAAHAAPARGVGCAAAALAPGRGARPSPRGRVRAARAGGDRAHGARRRCARGAPAGPRPPSCAGVPPVHARRRRADAGTDAAGGGAAGVLPAGRGPGCRTRLWSHRAALHPALRTQLGHRGLHRPAHWCSSNGASAAQPSSASTRCTRCSPMRRHAPVRTAPPAACF